MIRIPEIICCAAAVFLLSGGCSKNVIYVDYGDGAQGASGGGGAAALVTFAASIESRNMTRAVSPVQRNVRAEVYAFAGTAPDAAGTPAAMGAYLSPAPGLLQGVNDFRMYLPIGVYNFYAVSDHTQFAPPAFSGGLSEPLVNETDYLWWSGPQQDVTSAQAGIPIVFLHSAAQVLFEVEAGEGLTIGELALAHIYPPVPGAAMNLTTGVIPPASAFSTQISKMAVSGLTAQFTMLPVRSTSPLKVSFDVRIDGETTPRTYDLDVPLPGGELKAGDSYRFLAVIQGNGVSFASVGVTNWVDVDETGKPLYPSEL